MSSQLRIWPLATLVSQTAQPICIAIPLMLCLLFSALPAAAPPMTRTEPSTHPQWMDSYGKLPLSFEANQGQTDPRVKFLSRGAGYTLFLTGDSAVLSLHGKTANAALRMKLLGANPHASAAGADALPGKSNYFVGQDPKQWRTNVPTYAAVRYTGVYPGIDLVYHGNQRLLEYDFVVAPGADPRAIDLRFQGARKLSVNGEGALVIGLGASEVIEHAPVVYQEIGGVRQTLAGRYVLRGKGRVGFSVAEYDRSRELVIDPTLVYSALFGGIWSTESSAIAVDTSGNAYIAGTTTGPGLTYTDPHFPTTPGAFDAYCNYYCEDLFFVSKLNVAGSALVYSTYLGTGGGWNTPARIAVDASGNVYVSGSINSQFPTTPGAFQTTPGSGIFKGRDGFVTKLNATGSALVYSTYITGRYDQFVSDMAIDAVGNVYITGSTISPDFPTTPGAFQTTLKGPLQYNGEGTSNAFVSKLNAAGSALIYSTFLGGNAPSIGYGMAIDGSGNAYITGGTGSSDFPTTPGAFQTTRSGDSDGFVSKLNTAGSALVYSTFLGEWSGSGYRIAADGSGNAYVVGVAFSSDFPVTPGAFQTTYGGGGDVFVTKLNPAGSTLVYSTYLGGLGQDYPRGIQVDPLGYAYVTGATFSPNFPTTLGAFQTTFEGYNQDAFVTKFNASGSALVYSTYLGAFSDSYGIAVDAGGNAYLTGSGSVPFTPGAFHTPTGSAFVTKLRLGLVTTVTLNGLIGSNGWYISPVTVTLVATGASSPVSTTYYSMDSSTYQSYT